MLLIQNNFAEACYNEGYDIAAFWHTQFICRCYENCDGGGPTVLPSHPNLVMQKIPTLGVW